MTKKEKKELSLEEKIKINRELLESKGVLRDYDRNELLIPINIPILDMLYTMEKNAKSLL